MKEKSTVKCDCGKPKGHRGRCKNPGGPKSPPEAKPEPEVNLAVVRELFKVSSEVDSLIMSALDGLDPSVRDLMAVRRRFADIANAKFESNAS
jgi:hypothetical protein